MMKKINTTLYIAVFALLLLGCQHEIIPPAVLELGDYATIDFPVAGGTKEVAIQTNQTEWIATTSDSWLEVLQRPNKLILKAAPNDSFDDRKTTVLITAAGLTQKVDVTQAAGKTSLSLMGDGLHATETENLLQIQQNPFATTREIKVLTADPKWEFETVDATWLKAEKVPLESTLLLNIEENNTQELRTAILFVRTKDQTIQLQVKQEGALYFILPYLTPESTKEDVKDFEEARHSRVVQNASYLSGGAHTYHTKSPLFYEIKYSFDRRNLREVVMQCTTPEKMLSEEFTKLLESAGFEYKADSGMERVFIKNTLHNGTKYEIFANLVYGMPGVEPKAVFNVLKRQPGPMPTFDKLPDGIGHLGITQQEVIAWESTHGGTYSTTNSKPDDNYHFFNVLDKTYIARDYVFADGKLANMRIFTYDISKCFYSPAKGSFRMTDEFKALLTKEGFTEIRQTGDIWERFYINRARKLAVSARVTSFATVLSGQPLVIMMYVPLSDGDN